mmetsp:Transcript_5795/g.8480  ORF Transcript_5795/g.8480 Transcript_5795/m.8480 type:complete len:180 (-) Transcript_5795:228-767(-)
MGLAAGLRKQTIYLILLETGTWREWSVSLILRRRFSRIKWTKVSFELESLSCESLDARVLTMQEALKMSDLSLPFCALMVALMYGLMLVVRVWVAMGIWVHAEYFGIKPSQTIHIGNQFLKAGNNYAARESCLYLWVDNLEESSYLLKIILGLAKVEIPLDIEIPRKSLPLCPMLLVPK